MWKAATVTALHKKGPKNDASNYRPISLTSIVCKIYEKIIREHLLEHVSANIARQQHGFVAGRSCLSNLLECIDIINDMLASGDDVDVFYLDFQKAFDTVPHYRLITKLQNYGITGKTLAVISDFLSGRLFNVKVGDSQSQSHTVTSGIPQGSVLGPLLFLLYINDLPESIKNFVSLFADDVKLYGRASHYFDNQCDIDKLGEWQDCWLLRFNTEDDKCKVLHVGKNNPQHMYKLNNSPLPAVDTESDLGVVISSNWKWNDHIDKSISKANSCIAWVTRSVISRSPKVMINIYKSLIRPHLEYCVQLWSPSPVHGNWGTIMEIEHVQRRFTRLIDGEGLRTYEDRLRNLKLTTLVERRARGDLIEMYKIVSGKCRYGNNLFRLSRNGSKLVARPGDGAPQKHGFFSMRVLPYWNKLPMHVRTSETVEGFKINLENFKVKNISTPGHYWGLSQEIFSRISDSGRENYTNFMLDNPEVAKRKKVNIN